MIIYNICLRAFINVETFSKLVLSFMFVFSCSSFKTAYTNLKTDIEAELVTILETNILVKTAEVSVTDIEEIDFNRHKRMIELQSETRTIMIQFVSACYVRHANIIDINAIKKSLMNSIKSLETINVVRPKVIEIAPIISGSLIFLYNST